MPLPRLTEYAAAESEVDACAGVSCGRLTSDRTESTDGRFRFGYRARPHIGAAAMMSQAAGDGEFWRPLREKIKAAASGEEVRIFFAGSVFGGTGAAGFTFRRRVEIVMPDFATKPLPKDPDAIAPDGSEVRLLLELARGGVAHFELGPGQTSKAVVHQTVEEIWYFLSGRGQMWRQQSDQASVVDVDAGVCLTIPLGTQFQFRSFGEEPLAAIGITMPPWPGEGEAIFVAGEWEATIS